MVTAAATPEKQTDQQATQTETESAANKKEVQMSMDIKNLSKIGYFFFECTQIYNSMQIWHCFFKGKCTRDTRATKGAEIDAKKNQDQVRTCACL